MTAKSSELPARRRLTLYNRIRRCPATEVGE